MKRFWIGSAAALALSAPASSAPPRAPRQVGVETHIPYANRDGILDWKVAGPDTLYVQSMMGDWYLVRTSTPCPRLRTAHALGFVTTGGDRLDKFSILVAEGWRCHVASVTTSAPPPPAVARRG
jgi:hypothetical protein